ncbi:vacuolar protein sorting-associated protein 26C isoform X1 [Chelonia mydas]|uniref:vacuolar protein sorting-associated protein 26C isoform X1 n=1 Tax=Chelonia mydas TaxID=8469 RepID=UPI001CA94FEA|nr:vacuolar protein sorting-associated protein 26C isoform X1 [Chelonia mydas]
MAGGGGEDAGDPDVNGAPHRVGGHKPGVPLAEHVGGHVTGRAGGGAGKRSDGGRSGHQAQTGQQGLSVRGECGARPLPLPALAPEGGPRSLAAGRPLSASEVLSGVVVITSKDAVQHQGVSLTMEGSVNLQLSAKSVGVFEAFYNSVKPIQVINNTIEMVKPGKLPSGKTEIPFELPLHMKGNKVLYETYHGVFVNIQYTLRCDMRRSLLAKDLTKTCEFIVHSPPQKGKLMPSPVDFTITPETLQNVKERASLPKFLIKGHLNSTNCIITQPLTGELVVENAEAAVKSIELQLVRVETCGCAEGYARDATEIQNIQIADGDVCRSLSIPIYMVFPRLFTCPTLETTNFKVEFEVNIVVLLHDDHLITENFPLKLCRV